VASSPHRSCTGGGEVWQLPRAPAAASAPHRSCTKTRPGRRWALGLLAAPDDPVLVPAGPEHGNRWMGQFPCGRYSCRVPFPGGKREFPSNCAREAEAQVVVPVRRIVPVTVRRPAVPGVVRPTAAPVHPVRASTPSSLAPFIVRIRFATLPRRARNWRVSLGYADYGGCQPTWHETT
jgi:hypothetical protein